MPLLTLTTICGTAALIVTPIAGANSPLTWAVWGVFGFCVAASIVGYLVWSIYDPNRLQTEEYLLERQRLLTIGDERDPNNIKVIEGALTSNTAIREAR